MSEDVKEQASAPSVQEQLAASQVMMQQQMAQAQMMQQQTKQQMLLQMQKKNLGVALLLALLFGPLGLFYSTIPGGITMLIIDIVILIIGVVTLGFGFILFIFTQIACVAWAYIAVGSYNRKVLSAALPSGQE